MLLCMNCLLLVAYISVVIGTDEYSYRLPITINPIEYSITLRPNFSDPNEFTFTGYEEIKINISSSHFDVSNTNPSDLFTIQLHTGPDVEITSAIVFREHSFYINIANCSYDANTQIMSLVSNITSQKMQEKMMMNTWSPLATLNISFKGIILDDMMGFYISKYEYQNMTIYNGVTQFETVFARKAFPCFDEPSFKAEFSLIVIAPSICTVVSNMPIANTISLSDNDCTYYAPASMGGINTKCKQIEFEKSPKMSTYLVAFVIGLYNNISSSTKNGLKTTVYFPLNSDASYAQYALEEALSILPYYEDLFGIEFPLPKMDCIAVSDFAWGAMENWGLVIYSSKDLLVKGDTSSLTALNRVIKVIDHEYAHQWFGNIVTMSWWDDIWLNEGFATWVQHKASNFTHPQFEVWNSFLNDMDQVFGVDLSYYTHMVAPPSLEMIEISTMSFFDEITYGKGSSLIRMLYEFMGSEKFMNGIKNYLSSYVYRNAKTEQMFAALGGDDIAAMMNTWVLQSGFPVLNVTICGDTIHVEQTRMTKHGPHFYTNADYGALYALKYDINIINEYKQQIWYIPLQIELANATVIYTDNVIQTKNHIMNIDRNVSKNDDGFEYYILNKNMNGFFRVLYDEESFNLLIDSWLNDQLSDFNKFAILSDQSAFMLYNYITVRQYLDFVAKIKDKEINDASFLLWHKIIDSLITIQDLLCEKQPSAVVTNFESFARNILLPVWSSINKWNITDNDSENMISLRTSLLNALIAFNDKDTINYGYNLFINNIVVNDEIGVNDLGEIEGVDTNILRQILECALVHQSMNHTSADVLNLLLSVYTDLNSEYQQYVYNAAGAVYRNDDLHLITLRFILISTSVRDQDKLKWLNSMRRCYGREQTWDFITDPEYDVWEKLSAISGGDSVISIADTFASLKRYNNVYDFYQHQDALDERLMNQTLEDIQVNTEWINNNWNDIDQYLSTNGKQKEQKFSALNWIWIGLLIVLFLVILGVWLRWMRNKNINREIKTQYHQMNPAVI